MDKLISCFNITILCFSFLAALFAALFALYQIINNKRYFGLNLIAMVLSSFSNSEKLQRAFYEKFEYDTDNAFKYIPEKFHGSQEERDIDGLLRTFAIPAIAWERGQIDLKDVFPLEYYICRVVENSELKKYLTWLNEEWLKQRNIREYPFRSLQNLSTALIKNNPNLSNLVAEK